MHAPGEFLILLVVRTQQCQPNFLPALNHTLSETVPEIGALGIV
jgi:hypothetical protein